jgi:succinate dehydrogenase hydrophobic anchor subunit
VVIARLRVGLIRFVDAALVAAVLYHAGHGLISIMSDYIPRGTARTLLAIAVILLMGFFCRIGLQLIWSI